MNYSITLSFKRLTNSLLVVFVNYVVSKMKNNPVYADEADQVDVVELANTAFSSSITEAATGDHNKISMMHKRRAALETEVVALAKMLELRRDVDTNFYTDPGFELRKKPVRSLMPLEKPVIKFLKQGILSGTLDGEVVDVPNGVTQLAIQHSMDGGQAWNNGSYSAGKRFGVSFLQPRNSYLVRLRFHGSFGRMSDWSDPMSLFVL